MTTAQRIAQRMAGRRRGKDAIYTVVLDGTATICHTEATLDAWWASLAPVDKASLYEVHLDGGVDAGEATAEPTPTDLGIPTQLTVCGVRPEHLRRAEFLSALAEVARAARIMQAAKEVVADASL